LEVVDWSRDAIRNTGPNVSHDQSLSCLCTRRALLLHPWDPISCRHCLHQSLMMWTCTLGPRYVWYAQRRCTLSSFSSRPFISIPPPSLSPPLRRWLTLTAVHSIPSLALRHRQRPHLGRGGSGDRCHMSHPLFPDSHCLLLCPWVIFLSPSVPAFRLRSHEELQLGLEPMRCAVSVYQSPSL
jgi:hypothetical protein